MLCFLQIWVILSYWLNSQEGTCLTSEEYAAKLPKFRSSTSFGQCHWRIQEGRHLRVQFFSFSCSFRQKNRLAHPLWELASPLRKTLALPLNAYSELHVQWSANPKTDLICGKEFLMVPKSLHLKINTCIH